MKKGFIMMALVVMAAGAHAQWLDFSQNSNRYGIGFHLGQVGLGCRYDDFGAGASINAWGVYVDFAKAGPEHKYDRHVTNTLYNDSVAWTLSLGYQIPILPWLRLMPVVGYCQTNAGLTDATTVNVDVDTETSSASIYHDYDVTPGSRKHYFNIGAGIAVRPIKWIDIYAVGTMHAIYGGISLNLNAFAREDSQLQLD